MWSVTVYILSFESVLLPFVSRQEDCWTIFNISIIFFSSVMNVLLFPFCVGFFAAALTNSERSLCTQFVPTLEVSMRLQLVGETSLQGNEKQKRWPIHYLRLEVPFVICHSVFYKAIIFTGN